MNKTELLTREYKEKFKETNCTFEVKEILVPSEQKIDKKNELLTVIKKKKVTRDGNEEVEKSEIIIKFKEVKYENITIVNWLVEKDDLLDESTPLFTYLVKDNFENLIYTNVEMFAKFKSNLFCLPSIPTKKLNNAISAYAPTISKEKICFLYDQTVFGSAKEGFLITDSSMIYKVYSDKFTFRFLDYVSSEIIDKDDKKILIVTINNEGSEENFEIKEDWSVKITEFKEFLDFVKDLKNENYLKESDGYVIVQDLSDNIKLNYLKAIIIFTYLDDQEIDSEEVAEIQVLMTQLEFSAELRYKVRELITNAPQFDIKDTITELLSECLSGSEQALSVSLLKDIIRVHNATKKTSSLDNSIICNIAELLKINTEQLEFIEEAYQTDKQILSGEISDDQIIAAAKILASKAGAVGVPIVAIYMTGSVAGLSAAGLTSGLASLGLGGVLGLSSMVTGIGVVVILGVGVYKGMQWLMKTNERDKASRREFMLQDVLRIHQKTISNLAEDVNYFAVQLIDAIKDVEGNKLKIQKIAKQMTLFSNVIKALKAKEGEFEVALEEETNKRAA